MGRIVKLYILLGFLIFMSCNGDEPSAGHAPPKNRLAGLWINQTYLDSLRLTPSTRLNSSYGCTELYFVDTLNMVYVLNGDWEPTDAKYVQSGNRIDIVSSKKDSTVHFILNGNKLTQIATVGMKPKVFVHPPDTFAEGVISSKYQTAFERSINQILLTGRYQVVKASPVAPERGEAIVVDKDIYFSNRGEISGMGMYKSYSICSEGECKRYCDEMSLVYLSAVADRPGGKWYCWEYKNDFLYIYHAKSLEWMSNHPDIQPDGLWMVLKKRE
jgi:hypothetical protein